MKPSEDNETRAKDMEGESFVLEKSTDTQSYIHQVMSI